MKTLLILAAFSAFALYYVSHGQGIQGLTFTNIQGASLDLCSLVSQILQFVTHHVKTLATFSIWQLIVIGLVALFLLKSLKNAF
jgi:hypothetical protein